MTQNVLESGSLETGLETGHSDQHPERALFLPYHAHCQPRMRLAIKFETMGRAYGAERQLGH